MEYTAKIKALQKNDRFVFQGEIYRIMNRTDDSNRKVVCMNEQTNEAKVFNIESWVKKAPFQKGNGNPVPVLPTSQAVPQVPIKQAKRQHKKRFVWSTNLPLARIALTEMTVQGMSRDQIIEAILTREDVKEAIRIGGLSIPSVRIKVDTERGRLVPGAASEPQPMVFEKQDPGTWVMKSPSILVPCIITGTISVIVSVLISWLL